MELEACLAILGASRAGLCEDLRGRRSLAGLAAREFEAHSLRDTYYDSRGGELVAAGMALRWRRRTRDGQTRELLSFKGPGARHGSSSVARAELEGPPSRELLAELVDAIRAGGVTLAGAAESGAPEPHEWLLALGLEPVHSRVTERWLTHLRGADGGAVCELVIDCVHYDLEGRQVRHHELEFEALGSTRLEELEALAAALARESAGNLRPWPWSKTALGRALERLEQRGELAAWLVGEELGAEGYDAVEALLRVS